MEMLTVCNKSLSRLLEPPNASQMEHILTDTNESSEDKLLHNEQLILEWVHCQNHFPKEIDKGLIRGMLRGHKHILERTKRKLEQHLSARHLYPIIYSNRSPSAKDIIQAMDIASIAAMPKLTTKGHRIYVFALNRYNPAEFNFPHCCKLFCMIYDLILASDVPCNGEIGVFDAAHFSKGHFARFFGSFLRTLIVLLKEAYAIRIKGLHVVNAPSGTAKMIAAIKPFLPPKTRNNIHIYENAKGMANQFGTDCLPSNYGGNLKSLREIATDWYDLLGERAEWFEKQEQIKIVGVPEKVHDRFSKEDQLGVEGSFRKLEID